MPGRIPEERIELSRIGGYNKQLAKDPTPDVVAAERAARARLAVLQTRRRLGEAAQQYADAERRFAALGVVDA